MTIRVRYIVDDVEAAVDFYTDHLGFRLERAAGPGFAMLAREDLRLLLNAPGAGGAGRAMPDGTIPEPGGWNRFQLRVDDLDTITGRLHAAGVPTRSPIVAGMGGRHVLVDDPSGNPVELFEAPE